VSVDEEGAEAGRSCEVENVTKLVPRVLPANSSLRWSSVELALVDVNPEVPFKEAYAQYIIQCHSMNIAVRTFNAFSLKRSRMLKALK